MGAVVAHETGFAGRMPPYVVVPKNPAFTWELGKASWLGGRFESFSAGNPNEKEWRVRDLSRPPGVSDETLARRKALLASVDRLGGRIHGNDQLDTHDEFARKASELVLSPNAREAFSVEQESASARDAYGRSEFGQSCLLARRLVEAGVRFVTVNYGGWDHHAKIFEGLDKKLPEFDAGLAALVTDLHNRGMLSDTLLLVMGEFGRTPVSEGGSGRDHNHWGFSVWLAGGGIRGGCVHGATDEFGFRAQESPTSVHDLHATILHLMGFDHEKLTYRYAGRDFRLTDVHGRVVREILA
jgi:hypothetical protein